MPNSWLALDLKARVYRIGDKYQQAAKVYEMCWTVSRTTRISSKEARDILIDDIRYSLSGCTSI